MATRIIPTAAIGLVMVGLSVLASSQPSQAAQGEAARVIKEACGDDPEPGCVAKLQKICRGKVTLRCYYARKRRIDGPDGPDSPERADERDDRSIFYDE